MDRKPLFLGLAIGIASALAVLALIVATMLYVYWPRETGVDPVLREAEINAERLMEQRWLGGRTRRVSTGVTGSDESRPGVFYVEGGYFEPDQSHEGGWSARLQRKGSYWHLLDANP